MGTDLEVLPPGGETPGGDERTGRTRTRPRWPWAVVAVIVILGGLAFPVRSALARAELESCERVWADLLALDASRITLTNRLTQEAVPTDAQVVQRAVSELYREESTRVSGLGRMLPAHRSLDHGVGAVRSAISRALHLQLDDLRTAAPYVVGLGAASSPSPDTLAQFQKVSRMIDGQRRRFGETGGLTLVAPTLHAADGALATLTHYADSPVGVRLLVTTNFGPRLLDVDRSRDIGVAVGPSAQVLYRAGFVIVADGGQVYRLPTDFGGARRSLGTGTAIFAATRPDTVWIADVAGLVREVTIDGKLITGPALPRATVLGSVGSGLVVTNGNLAILDHSLTVIQSLETAPSLLVAAGGDTVAWIRRDDPVTVRLYAPSSGRTTSVTVPVGFEATAFGAAARDGRRLALYLLDQATAEFTPAVIDLTTGSVRILSGTETPDVHLSMAWTSTGSRLFFTTDQAQASIATWSPGDAGPTILRWRGSPALGLAVLPSVR